MKFYPRLILAAALLVGVGGCAQLGYTVQAMQGQLSLMSQAKPIDDWLSDPLTTNELKERLRRVRSIRTFAAKELSLPDNGSYKKYADLKRQYVLWNVVATPELSVKPNQWCFPVEAVWIIGATTARRRPSRLQIIFSATDSMSASQESQPTQHWAGLTTRSYRPSSPTQTQSWRD